jgi:hypothetical protein
MREGQRGSNKHPGSSAAEVGTMPSIVCNGLEREVLKVGTEFNSPRV